MKLHRMLTNDFFKAVRKGEIFVIPYGYFSGEVYCESYRVHGDYFVGIRIKKIAKSLKPTPSEPHPSASSPQ